MLTRAAPAGTGIGAARANHTAVTRKTWITAAALTAIFLLAAVTLLTPQPTHIVDAVLARDARPGTCEPVDPRDSFASGEGMHLCVRLTNAHRGRSEVTARWYQRDHQLPSDTRWVADDDGDGWIQFPLRSDTFPAGAYRVEVSLDGHPERQLTFTMR